MNAHHNHHATHRGDPTPSSASENVHEIIVGVLIASFTIGAIPIFQIEALSGTPDPFMVVPSEATLWSEVQD